MSTLHLFCRGLDNPTLLDDALRAATAEDALLFLEDGVIWACHSSLAERLMARSERPRFYALEADLRARALAVAMRPPTTAVDDAGFVALAEHYPRSITWF